MTGDPRKNGQTKTLVWPDIQTRRVKNNSDSDKLALSRVRYALASRLPYGAVLRSSPSTTNKSMRPEHVYWAIV
ncbi:hypothetical protein PAXRUDRAFT_828640 [Paxillus rubicundulus Ve08.2h10]|uniref:Uncharacterized protein n=1 Tax=Paxillus rubicundulus Ve08.2h10 TaxID=930991 RepID=A0A0D0DP91_9AGAM|nr:hypothetical protein PAXRUDRAFT_828640 [Paxillus rubicundulus Ve08.2h10]